MKHSFRITSLILAFIIAAVFSYAQKTPNRMAVTVDGKLYKAEPRKITYGSSVLLTGNTVGPDKSLRIGVGNWASPGAYAPGKYLIVAPDQDIPKDQIDRLLPENFIGIATLRYIEETKAPRMRYHKGNSGNNNEILMLSVKGDSTIIEFQSVSLTGTNWKEKVTATVLGGVGRLEQKMKDKAKTKVTGYEVDIDPEHNGYHKEDGTDVIMLTNGRISLSTKQQP